MKPIDNMDNCDAPTGGNFISEKLPNMTENVKQIYLEAMCRRLNRLRFESPESLRQILRGSKRTRFNLIKKLKGTDANE